MAHAYNSLVDGYPEVTAPLRADGTQIGMIKPFGPGGFGRYSQYFPKEAVRHPGKIHGCLAEKLISMYSNKGDLVLDPMCGVGTIPVIASLMGRDAYGNDVSIEYFNLCNRVTADKSHLKFFNMDARDFVSYAGANNYTFDAIITSPPYADRLSGHYKADASRDIGRLAPFAWYNALSDIYTQCLSILKPKGYFVCIIGRSKDKRGWKIYNCDEMVVKMFVDMGLKTVREWAYQKPSIGQGPYRNIRNYNCLSQAERADIYQSCGTDGKSLMDIWWFEYIVVGEKR